jgi:hypothetical protein
VGRTITRIEEVGSKIWNTTGTRGAAPTGACVSVGAHLGATSSSLRACKSWRVRSVEDVAPRWTPTQSMLQSLGRNRRAVILGADAATAVCGPLLSTCVAAEVG